MTKNVRENKIYALNRNKFRFRRVLHSMRFTATLFKKIFCSVLNLKSKHFLSPLKCRLLLFVMQDGVHASST